MTQPRWHVTTSAALVEKKMRKFRPDTSTKLSSPSEPSHNIHHQYRAPSPVSSGSRHMNTKENISRDGVGKTG